MNNFKNHLLVEEIKASHAAKLYSYLDIHHDEMCLIIRDRLCDRWTKLIKEINKKFHPEQDYIQKLNIHSLDVTPIKISDSSMQVHNSRFANNKNSLCTLLVSTAFNEPDKKIIIKMILNESKKVIEEVIFEFQKIFHIEKLNNNVESVFEVNLHDDEIKLKFISSYKGKVTLKTIFLIGVEYGKRNSKTKIFDKVFFVDMIK